MTQSILVVDDDLELRDSICEILAEAGYLVAPAANGEEALDCLGRQKFDLVLLDLIMPGLGGKEALALIKRQAPFVRVIMITAFATIDNAVSAMRAGADDYLTKPFKVDDLLAAVRRGLEEARVLECHDVLDANETFNALSNSMRRDILALLAREGRLRFMDVARKLEVADHTKVNFHVKILRDAGFVEQDRQKFYLLSGRGRKIVDCMKAVFTSQTTGR